MKIPISLKKTLLVFCMLVFCTPLLPFCALAQTTHRDYSAWNQLFVNKHFKNHIHTQIQLHRRNKEFYSTLVQQVVRPVVSYNIKEHTSVGIGYTYSKSESLTPAPLMKEHNVFQNIMFKQPCKGFYQSHNIRVEQRFKDHFVLKDGVYEHASDTFSTRFRYRYTLKVPLITEKRTTLSLLAYDELFIKGNQRLNPQKFDQNWIYFGPELKISDHVSLTSGYHDIYQKNENTYLGNTIWDTQVILTIP